MIIDSHCHAWAAWPYRPPVPDPDSRARIEQLLYEMDSCGVDRALVVCAEIDRNPDNNAYVAAQVARFPDRLLQVVDLDSFWSPRYHQPGAAQRLAAMAQRWPIVGFTHYLTADDNGDWLLSAEGSAVFDLAAERHLAASIHCRPAQMRIIRALAAQFPAVHFLVHHLGHIPANEPAPRAALNEVLESADASNIALKVSGYYYALRDQKWEYPYDPVHDILTAVVERFGSARLCWGSDFPVSRPFVTYRQTMEMVRTHLPLPAPSDVPLVLGDNLARILRINHT